jgi:hypothetical protein
MDGNQKDQLMTTQARLDKGADALMQLIRAAQAGAAEMCAAGDHDTAAKLHQMAGHMQIAYGIGRTIKTADGIAPQSGGK